jgi:aquaporin related protein
MVQTIVSQFLAAMAASGFVAALLPGPLTIATKLILTILMLEGGPSKPMYIGLALFGAELCSAFFTGGSLNPARSFGPCIIVGFPEYHWIYWLGPLMGSGVASGAHWIINFVRLEQS